VDRWNFSQDRWNFRLNWVETMHGAAKPFNTMYAKREINHLTVLNDLLQLVQHTDVDEALFPDHAVVLILTVVRISHLHTYTGVDEALFPDHAVVLILTVVRISHLHTYKPSNISRKLLLFMQYQVYISTHWSYLNSLIYLHCLLID
jgi:hypothetical protein